jgi:N-acetyl sugar amidotransferase
MDTTDVDITFDKEGVCNHCRGCQDLVSRFVWTEERTRKELPQLVEQIKKAGRGKEYDCVIGVSGGVDSTFVAYKVAKLGLRALAVHLDNGWDSALAVTNIQRTMDKLGLDLFTEVLDWDEFKDLQLAFLRASTPDSEVPTDHAILAVLLGEARKRGIGYIFFGGNVATESILPPSWSQGGRDWMYIDAVHKQYGTTPLRSFPHLSSLESVLLQTGWLGPQWIRLLDRTQYRRSEALKILEVELGWHYYGGKHHESVYTRFFQSYILPTKFNVDKRRAHMSSLINAGEMTREQALDEISEPSCPPDLLQQDKEFVMKKLGLSEKEFSAIMALPPKSIQDYPHFETSRTWRLMSAVYRSAGYMRRLGDR